MSSAEWEEIKRLAADFQKAQLADTLYRLSERNCVEVINKLIELNLLNVYHSCNGKEYITPTHLKKEILDELYVEAGRINLVDLAQRLNVDLKIIELEVEDLLDNDPGLTLILGQLISRQYEATIVEEINELLQRDGSVTVGNIAKIYSLPGNYLSKVIGKYLGSQIQGVRDESDASCIYTITFKSRQQAKIRGMLSAITQPTMISSLIAQYKLHEKMFFSIADSLISSGRIAGTITGEKLAPTAVYVPDIYSKNQLNWVRNFYRQNGYFDFQSLHQLGFSDPCGYIKHHFQSENLLFIENGCIGPTLVAQVESSIDEALITGSFVDIYPLMPGNFTEDSMMKLVEHCLEKRLRTSALTAHIYCKTMVVSDQLLMKIMNHLESLMPTVAQRVIDAGVFKPTDVSIKQADHNDGLKSKKDERRKKAASGKAGGGTQGRETKTKAVKSKGGRGNKGARDSDEEDSSVTKLSTGFTDVDFLTREEMQEELLRLEDLNEAPEELLEEISATLYLPMKKKFVEIAKSIFYATIASGTAGRKNYQQMEQKILALLASVKLSEKGIHVFGDDIQKQLYKYLLKTQCTELVTELALYLSDDVKSGGEEAEMSSEARLKIVNRLPDDVRPALLSLTKSLNAADLTEFFQSCSSALEVAGITFKMKDNKRDRQIQQQYRANMIEQLKGCIDSALLLHLASLILFYCVSGCMLHASGKFVPHIIAYLKKHIPEDKYSVLVEFQGLVVKLLSNKSHSMSPDEASQIQMRLEELTPEVKSIATSFKRSVSESSAD